MKYIRQLDSLRAIAIITVVIVHWWPKNTFLYSASAYFNAPAVFFTLSGFLITSILIKEKNRAATAGSSRRPLLLNFYYKRALRLFPGYFLVLLIWYVFKPGPEPVSYKYYVAFLVNIYINRIQQWPALAHLWSMAVEEQFYLIWPWVILFTPKKALPYAILIFIGIGSASYLLTSQNDYSGLLLNNCMDSLATGALLGWLVAEKRHLLTRYRKWFDGLAIVAMMLFAIQIFFNTGFIIRDRLLVSVATAWLITWFLNQEEDKSYSINSIFNNGLLRRLGKISYGIYLYHFIIPYFTRGLYAINGKLHLPTQGNAGDYVWIIENSVILLVVAAISYQYFEQPVMKLRTRRGNIAKRLTGKKQAVLKA